jgi:hypothetical protein
MILLRIHKFREFLCMEGQTAIVYVNEITFTRVP